MKRAPLLLAVLLSLLLHLALLGSGLLPSFSPVPDTRLQPIRIRLASLDLGHSKRPPATVTATATVGTRLRITHAPTPTTAGDGSAPVREEASAARAEVARAEASAPPVEASQALAAPADNAYLKAAAHHKRFPDRVELRYQVYYGVLMAGTATIEWKRDGDRYSLDSRIVSILGQRLHYLSQGSMDAQGIKPDSFTAWRDDQPYAHARFDRDKALLIYGSDHEQQVPLQAGAQDFFSAIYQLALKGASAQPVQVTNGKKVYQYPLNASGEADFDTGFGMIHALVFRAQGDGNLTEFWLAPDFSNQPARIIFTGAGLRLDMRVTDIVIDEQNQWHLPKPIHRKNQR